jgi:hypothetical protein
MAMTHEIVSQKEFKQSVFDPSLWVIILGNIITIVLAIAQQWPMGQILWVYWGQSVMIGVINFFRILSLKEFTTDGMKQNGQPVPETQSAKKSIAFFFAIHYGFFHFVYFIFLWQDLPLSRLPASELMLLLLLIFGFFSSHGFSYRYNLDKDFKDKKPNLGTIMFYPYLRIIPMHLTIIFGSMMFSTASLVFFMLLKTAADAGMHMVEHHLFRKKA